MHAHVIFDDAVAKAMSASRPPTPARLLEQLEDPRVERLAAIVIAQRGDPDAVVRQNDSLFTLVKENPRLFAVASVHPDDGPRALEELDRVKKLGARMLKLHQNTQGFDLSSPGVAAIVKRAGELGLPVLFEGTSVVDPGTVGKFVRLAATNPDTKIVLAHMGFTEFSQMLIFHELEVYPWWRRNVYFDISATAPLFSESPFAAELQWTIQRLGSDRVMFGSDFPVATTSDSIKAAVRLTAGLSVKERDDIFRNTAAALLGL